MIHRKFIFIIFLLTSLALSSQTIEAKFKTDQTMACDTMNLTLEYIGLLQADTLIWDFGDGQSDTALNVVYEQTFYHTFNVSGHYTITLTAIKNNVHNSKSQSVDVYDSPNADFQYDLYGYNGILDTFYFSNRKYLFNADYPDNKHWWWVNNSPISENNDSIVYNFANVGSYTISHQVEVNGCKDSTGLTISIKDIETKIPNVFTPNNDGINDLFYIQTDGVSKYTLTIINRQGNRVYQTEGSIIKWDGYSYWGELLDTATYYYILEKEGGDYKRGIVYLIR